MNWYYADGGTQHGPIEEPAFQAMVGAGTIKPGTLVWREGFTEWVPYGQLSQSAAVPVSAVAGVRAPVVARPAVGGQACSQCGQLFAADEMVSYEGRFICAGCKPAFFQRIKEGAAVAGDREYARFWIRFRAKFVDGILVQIGSVLIGFVVGFALKGSDSAGLIAPVLALVFQAFYVIFFVGKFGATPGKMVFKLEIIRPDGSPMTYGRATGRYFAEFLSGLTIGIGYIMAAFDEEKRALHDRVADTRVVRKL